MSLNGALQIGRSALLTSQAGIQLAGNNMANAATPGYRRQVASLVAARSDRIGPDSFLGTGVMLQSITRVVDTALQSRVRTALSREAGAQIDARFLSTIESLQNELSDNDLSTLLSTFFNSFSELANNPNDDAVRSVVLRQGAGLADRVQGLRGDYTRVRDEVDDALGAAIEKADGLLDQIATINGQIIQTEQGSGQANGLRDARDQLINDLSAIIDVSTVEQTNGSVDVLVGSLPVVIGAQSRGIELRTRIDNNATVVDVRISADGSILLPQDGTIGALLRQRDETVDPAIDTLDTFAHELIYQVNRLHSQGQGKSGWESVTGTTHIANATTALNADATELPFDVRNGSFRLSVTNSSNDLRQAAQILIDPDTMSLNDVVTAINAAGLSNVTAVATADGKLQLTAAAGYELSFSDDSSGVLAALGVNSFFNGKDANDIAVSADLLENPELLATSADHVPGTNATAMAIVALQDQSIEGLGGRSLRGFWQASVTATAVRTSAALDAADSSNLVRENLESQEQATSGVSLDEESIDLLSYQRQFQAAARFISTIDETMQVLLSIA